MIVLDAFWLPFHYVTGAVVHKVSCGLLERLGVVERVTREQQRLVVLEVEVLGLA